MTRSSIFELLSKRERGLKSVASQNKDISFIYRQKGLADRPEIVSPNRGGIASLSIAQDRFLLAGSVDSTVSVYDVSKIGSEEDGRTFRPVARSIRVPAAVNQLDIPSGHSSSLVHVQWYPADAGAFVSASTDGNLLCFDTERMEPVWRAQPHASCSCAHMQPIVGETSGPLIATGSHDDPNNSVQLVDLRSGAASHQLLGHDAGVTAVQWSSASPGIILASGSRDGSVRLWDIRKPGSRSCLATLHREARAPVSGTQFKPDYSHLVKVPPEKNRGSKRKNIGNSRSALMPAPNNYNHIQSKGVRSHNGSVTAVAFFNDGHSLASVGSDGEMLVWDLTGRNAYMLPSRFVAPGAQFAGGSVANGRRRPRRAPICVDNNQDTIWIGHSADLLEFTIDGGSPTQILKGHLHTITAIQPINQGLSIFTGSEDGQIVTWGPNKTAGTAKKDEDNW